MLFIAALRRGQDPNPNQIGTKLYGGIGLDLSETGLTYPLPSKYWKRLALQQVKDSVIMIASTTPPKDYDLQSPALNMQPINKRIRSIKPDGMTLKPIRPLEDFIILPPPGFLAPKPTKIQLLEFTKDDLRAPLSSIETNLTKSAIKCFKLLQRAMGDRKYGISHWNLTREAKRQLDLSNIHKLLVFGTQEPAMRDELFLQVYKQTRENPSDDSILKGWEILCVYSNTFPPTADVGRSLINDMRRSLAREDGLGTEQTNETYLDPESHHDLSWDPEMHQRMIKVKVHIMKQFVINNMERLLKMGPRGTIPNLDSVEILMNLPFSHQVFGVPLAKIMEFPEHQDESGLYPKILSFLSEAILVLGGQNTEGIFRVPGNHDEIHQLRLRISKGEYSLEGIRDPHTPASLLKAWFRELAEPVVPSSFYDRCVKIGSDVNRAFEILGELPQLNKDVLAYLIKFLQFMGSPKYQERSKMTPNNLAMVFSPSVLRCPSDDPLIILAYSRLEQNYVKVLINYFDEYSDYH